MNKLAKVCFVIGPIGPPSSEIRAAADDFINYIVAPCVVDIGYDKPIRADMLPEPGRITSQIIELLNSADLVIADLSTNNANVYYELSCRHAIGKPAIHMAVEGTPLSFDVADNRTIFYTMHARRVDLAREELKGQIERVHEAAYKVRNPILDAIGLITLEKSTEPTQQALASLVRKIDSLQHDVADLTSYRRNALMTGYPPSAFVPGTGIPGISSATLYVPDSGIPGISSGGLPGNEQTSGHDLSALLQMSDRKTATGVKGRANSKKDTD
jgi:hypothetical protein